MHSSTKTYLLLTLLPFALANLVSQISDGQIQEPAEAPAAVAPKIAIAPTSAPAAPAPPPPTSTSVSVSVVTASPTPTPSPSPPPALAEAGTSVAPPSTPSPPALKEAGASVAPATANTSVPAPARIEEAAATTGPILIASPHAANTTIPPHHAHYEVPHASASVGKMLPVENGTAPTVPALPTLSQAATSVEGSPREAGTTQAASKGGASKLAGGIGLAAMGMGLVAVLIG